MSETPRGNEEENVPLEEGQGESRELTPQEEFRETARELRENLEQLQQEETAREQTMLVNARYLVRNARIHIQNLITVAENFRETLFADNEAFTQFQEEIARATELMERIDEETTEDREVLMEGHEALTESIEEITESLGEVVREGMQIETQEYQTMEATLNEMEDNLAQSQERTGELEQELNQIERERAALQERVAQFENLTREMGEEMVRQREENREQAQTITETAQESRMMAGQLEQEVEEGRERDETIRQMQEALHLEAEGAQTQRERIAGMRAEMEERQARGEEDVAGLLTVIEGLEQELARAEEARQTEEEARREAERRALEEEMRRRFELQQQLRNIQRGGHNLDYRIGQMQATRTGEAAPPPPGHPVYYLYPPGYAYAAGPGVMPGAGGGGGQNAEVQALRDEVVRMRQERYEERRRQEAERREAEMQQMRETIAALQQQLQTPPQPAPAPDPVVAQSVNPVNGDMANTVGQVATAAVEQANGTMEAAMRAVSDNETASRQREADLRAQLQEASDVATQERINAAIRREQEEREARRAAEDANYADLRENGDTPQGVVNGMGAMALGLIAANPSSGLIAASTATAAHTASTTTGLGILSNLGIMGSLQIGAGVMSVAKLAEWLDTQRFEDRAEVVRELEQQAVAANTIRERTRLELQKFWTRYKIPVTIGLNVAAAGMTGGLSTLGTLALSGAAAFAGEGVSRIMRHAVRRRADMDDERRRTILEAKRAWWDRMRARSNTSLGLGAVAGGGALALGVVGAGGALALGTGVAAVAAARGIRGIGRGIRGRWQAWRAGGRRTEEGRTISNVRWRAAYGVNRYGDNYQAAA